MEMEPGERQALLEACRDEDKRVLKAFGYYCIDHLRDGKKPEDLEDVNRDEVERIAGFLQKHPMRPVRKRRKRVRYWDTYYLGYSYGLKHVVEKFIGYITNGDFIAACMSAGLIVVPEPESPNALIYIPRDSADQHSNYYIVV
jgi:hypothetical protein